MSAHHQAVSGKFMPLDQWLYFDALECLPEDKELLPNPEDCHPVRTDGESLVQNQGWRRNLRNGPEVLIKELSE